ncbi:MAG TPA: type II secretion system protein [Candidatus Saccharimonadales bacterium]
MNRRSGFTVVELLMVIVVIAILAAVTIVTYSGVQQRARNAQTAGAVNQYLKIFKLYASNNNGTYPTSANLSGAQYACLGEDYTSNVCWNGGVTENTWLNGELKKYGSLPMPASISQGYTGIIYIPPETGWTLDGQPMSWIAYPVDGGATTTRCPVGPIASYVSGINFTPASPASGQTTAGSATQNPICWIPLK